MFRNPWIGGNIDDGPLATATLDNISQDLFKNWSERNKVDPDVQESNKNRLND